MADKVVLDAALRIDAYPIVTDGWAIFPFGGGFVVGRGDGVLSVLSFSVRGFEKGQSVWLVASLAEAMTVAGGG